MRQAWMDGCRFVGVIVLFGCLAYAVGAAAAVWSDEERQGRYDVQQAAVQRERWDDRRERSDDRREWSELRAAELRRLLIPAPDVSASGGAEVVSRPEAEPVEDTAPPVYEPWGDDWGYDPCPADEWADPGGRVECWVWAARFPEPWLAVRVAWHESKWVETAKNPDSSATGIFQFLTSTWNRVLLGAYGQAGRVAEWSLEDRLVGWRNVLAARLLYERGGWSEWEVCRAGYDSDGRYVPDRRCGRLR